MKTITSVVIALSMFCFACNNSAKESGEKVDSAADNKMSDADENAAIDEFTSKFMTEAANGGMAEVEMGRVGKDKASNATVKDFASMMVNDHSKANDELKSLANDKKVTLPGSMTDDHKTKLEDLKKKSGTDFDKAYMDMMVDDHEKDVREFEKASGDVRNSDVKAWVDRTLPTLRKHLDSAKAIQKAIKQ